MTLVWRRLPRATSSSFISEKQNLAKTFFLENPAQGFFIIKSGHL